jgi:AbrB family looped-hinge helix DNA binding protein
MKTTIDSAGRVVIPKELRERLGLTGGQEVEVVERNGLIEIEPAAVPMAIEHGPHGPVIVPSRPLPPLTDAIVRQTLDRVRR